ncbi:MAG: alpha/beta hydrolase [Spirochaetes bacterium]|nr:alpha/beta hydrolase [Spirochaetota bacterium]
MTGKKQKILIAISAAAILALALIIPQTRLFKPSLGARMARMTVKLYLAPAFASEDFVQNVRNRLENISMLALLPPGTSVEEISIGDMKADWICASGVDPKIKKAILYLHGGGFLAGSRNTHREMVVRISKASGIPALVPEYRRAPEHKFPAALDDCLAAYRWLLAQGYTPKNIAIGGDSAGGCLTVMTLLSLRDAGTPLPGAAFLISPLTDAVNFDGESIKTKDGIDPWFNPKDMPRHLGLFTDNYNIKSPLLSPVRQNLAGLPPLLIHVGTDEILLSDSTRLAERAKKAGVDATIRVWDGMWHVFQSFAVIIPEARDAIEEIGEFLKKRI